jgi:hypothetical protein
LPGSFELRHRTTRVGQREYPSPKDRMRAHLRLRSERFGRPLQGLDAVDGEPYLLTTFKLHETVNVSLPQHELLYYESCPPALAHRRRALPSAPEGYVFTEHFDVNVVWKRDATQITVGVCSHLWTNDGGGIRCLLPRVFIAACPIKWPGLSVAHTCLAWLPAVS